MTTTAMRTTAATLRARITAIEYVARLPASRTGSRPTSPTAFTGVGGAYAEHFFIGGDASELVQATSKLVQDEEDSRGKELRVGECVLVNFGADAWGDIYGRVVPFEVLYVFDKRGVVKVANSGSGL